MWEVTRLGFMIGLNPDVYDPKQAHEKMVHELANKLPQYTKIPKFALVYSSPSVMWNHRTFRTKAYSIEAEKKTSIELMKLLTKAYKKETKEYVPFQQRNKHPEAYAKHVVRHTEILAANRTIVLNHCGRDVMFYLHEYVMEIPGVQAVVPAPSVDIDGKYRVSVHKDRFYSIRKFLQNNLAEWCEQYVMCDNERTLKFAGKPEVAAINSDGYSSGEGSYMTDSVNTAMSYGSDLSDLTHLESSSQEQHKEGNAFPQAPAGWAARIRESLQIKEVGYSTSDTTTPTTSGNEELISDLASSRAEVDDLKQKMAQLEMDKDLARREEESRDSSQ